MPDYPTDEYVRTVCKIGQRHDCCRYLAMGRNGWSCEKLNPELKAHLDSRGDDMTARGDNCAGLGSR